MRPIVFTVKGKGSFPVDMLRHDQCYPMDAESVENIQCVKTATGSGSCISLKHQIVRKVQLVNVTGQAPTKGRWNSFGWVVEL